MNVCEKKRERTKREGKERARQREKHKLAPSSLRLYWKIQETKSPTSVVSAQYFSVCVSTEEYCEL